MRLFIATLVWAFAIFTPALAVFAQTPRPRGTPLPNKPPTATLSASKKTITLPCPPDSHSNSGQCPVSADMSVQLKTAATDPDGDSLLYSYSVSGGRITGEGANVTWDLSGVAPATYTATVEVDDGCGCITSTTTTVTVANCPDCIFIDFLCPTVSVECLSEVEDGAALVFYANAHQGTPEMRYTFKWTVSAGTITNGQSTSSITVNTAGLGGQSIIATVEVGGLDPSCSRTASCTTPVRPRVIDGHFDEYGNIKFNDEKARLDNFAIQLQNEPTAQGYIIAHGSCKGEGRTRANRARNYLVNTRGLDAGRLLIVDGGCLPELQVQLSIVPQGATPPTGDAVGAVSPCPECKRPVRRISRPRRGQD